MDFLGVDHLEVKQICCKPYTLIKGGAGTIHRGIANRSDKDRPLFWVNYSKTDYKIIDEQAESQSKRVKREKAASITSRGSKGAVPSVKTKFKPVSKLDTPSQIKKSDSQRFGEAKIEESSAGQKKSEGSGDKLFMTLFLLVGMLAIYWAMTPSSKI